MSDMTPGDRVLLAILGGGSALILALAVVGLGTVLNWIFGR